MIAGSYPSTPAYSRSNSAIHDGSMQCSVTLSVQAAIELLVALYFDPLVVTPQMHLTINRKPKNGFVCFLVIIIVKETPQEQKLE